MFTEALFMIIFKNHPQLNKKKTNNLIKKWSREVNTLPNEYVDGKQAQEKMHHY